METIRGRTSHVLDLYEFQQRVAGYHRLVLDLGTGDGRYARFLAARHPDWFVIGLDSCRENLREHSRAKAPNLLFVIARAQALPGELQGLVSHLTINFPWGSLLQSMLAGEPEVIRGLELISHADAAMEVRLNGGALEEAGSTLEAGTERIHMHLLRAGWHVRTPVDMNAGALRDFPSTWAKRLAFGRDPRAALLSARR